MVATDG